jgi:hypothetical protein
MGTFSEDDLARSPRGLRQGVFAILLGALGAGGCGGKVAPDSEVTLDAGSPVTREQFIATYASSVCDYFARCGRSLGLAAGTSCAEAALEDPRLQRWSSPQLHFNSGAAATCLATLTQYTCQDFPECPEVLRGDGVAGAACSRDEECNADFACDLSAGCPGLCVPLPHAGEACLVLAATSGGYWLLCGAGSFCRMDEVGIKGVCLAPKPVRRDSCVTVSKAGLTLAVRSPKFSQCAQRDNSASMTSSVQATIYASSIPPAARGFAPQDSAPVRRVNSRVNVYMACIVLLMAVMELASQMFPLAEPAIRRKVSSVSAKMVPAASRIRVSTRPGLVTPAAQTKRACPPTAERGVVR